MKKNFIFKRVLTLVLAVMMLVTAAPVNLLAEPGGASGSKKPYEIVFDDKSVVRMEDYLNKSDKDGLAINPAKLKEGQTAAELIKNPAQPDIYTMRADYKVKRGNDYVINYQPYIVSVGEDIPDPDKDKVSKIGWTELPELDGYTKPTPRFNVEYGFIKKEVLNGSQSGNSEDSKYKKKSTTTEIPNYGIKHELVWPFNYEPKKNEIQVIHVFQHLYDNQKYGIGEEEEGLTKEQKEELGIKDDIYRKQYGYTGETISINPVEEKLMKGYEPEVNEFRVQIPESTENFVIKLRYNRKHYNINYNTKGGTEIPVRTLYYEQEIPKIDSKEVPRKIGSDLIGWKPSCDLIGRIGNTKTVFKANEIIRDSDNNPIVDFSNIYYETDNLGEFKRKDGKNVEKISSDIIKLFMPAEDVTFTAEWKDKEKANYAVQFWAEKADHADGASLLEKYEYMGTRVYKDHPVKVLKEGKWVGFSPNLDEEPVKDIVFPDLDKARLEKIWNGAKFNRGKNLYLNKFYVYNKTLTHKENADPEDTSITKSISSTGQTVYNIYYDRQVYDLYFTKSNAQPDKNTIYPEIWGYDPVKEEAVMLGGPGNPYHYKARFNEMMYKWPNDAKQTKGFTPGYQSFGWGPNYTQANWPVHLDTPPYRLNADEFLDMANYTNWGGYVNKIDAGKGRIIKAKDFTTLSFGIKQDEPSIPHHMDFWMDGFKSGETIIRYDLVRTKADTAGLDYGHKYPIVTGFTPRDYDPKNPQSAWPVIREGSEEHGRVNEDEIGDLNDERDDITPNNSGTYYNNQGVKLPIGQLDFIAHFFSDSDEFGDVKEGGQEFEQNGYLRFFYKRNKYPLRFNYDPTITKDDSEFNYKNQLMTFYEFPLKALSPDVDTKNEYKKAGTEEGLKNLIDNPINLQKLGLKELIQTDSKDNKLKVRRPDNISEQMVFKGWALDPAGTKLIWENDTERMPSHAVNLYAKWGDPDYQWRVTIDPNLERDKGSLANISADSLTTEKRIIQVGDIGQEEKISFPKKEANEGKKQVFTVIHKQKLNELPKPERKGYDFMGWEIVRFKKNSKGEYTNDVDDYYRKTYKVPELYTFGNDVVSDIYLKAIWVKNEFVDVNIFHHFLDKNYIEDKEKLEKQTDANKRTGSDVTAVASRQSKKWYLAPDEELRKHNVLDYIEYTQLKDNNGNPRKNTYNQYIKVGPEKVEDPEDSSKEILNPNNNFHFYYRPFRQREYTVKYIDERAIEKLKTAKNEQKDDIINKYAIITDEKVVNGNRYTDARNYRPIPGWKLVSAPQQQLFFDVDEATNEFLGINDTGKTYITFMYKDVRVIETKKDAPVPKDYVRVTFKADKGGAFKDKDGKEVNELYYDVIKGLRSDLLPVPQEWVKGEKNPDGSDKQKEDGKFYITPDEGKNFIKWDSKPLLNANTIIEKDDKDYYTFTAKFDWSDVSVKGLVRTESFDDNKATSSKDWSNNFAPTLEELKKLIIYKVKDKEKPLPEGTKVSFESEVDTSGSSEDIKPITDDAAKKAIYDKVKEHDKADTEELVRTEKIKTLIKFKDGKNVNVLEIPIKVYKNRYEALTTGEKPLFLREAEGKTAEDGGLKEILKDTVSKAYVKVTVAPTGDLKSKDNKVYYVNPKAWVDIPKVDTSDNVKFTNWKADRDAQNEKGVFDFAKRHKFTEDTIIIPEFTENVIPQTGTEKPTNVPKDFVKVEFVTTQNGAMSGTKIFWVKKDFDLTIPVTDPIGIGYFTFKEWKIGANAEGDVYKPNEARKFTADTTITATYDEAQNIIDYNPKEPITRPEGYIRISFEADNGITLTESKAYYVKKNAKDEQGNSIKLANSELFKPKYKLDLGYKFIGWNPDDNTLIGENDIVVTAKSTAIEDVIEKINTSDIAPTGYKTVIFKAGDNGTVSEKTYFVNPNKYITLKAPTDAKGNIGYEFASWSKDATIPTQYKKEETVILAHFNPIDAVSTVKKDGYNEVTFVISSAGGKIPAGETITYYVNPNVEVKLNPPKTVADIGYVFGTWAPDPVVEKYYKQTKTEIKGTFTKLADIIAKEGASGENSKPAGYVTVTFDQGEHAKEISGKTIYYVNPNANKTLADITKPTITAETGWKQKANTDAWSVLDTKEIKDNITVTANYDALPDVDESTKYEGYIEVKFVTTEKGTIEGSTETEKTVYVNPNKAVALAAYAPKINAGAQYEFSSWDTDLTKQTVYKNRDKITAQYNDKDAISKTEKKGYIEVEFKTDAKGELSGYTKLWVNPGVDLTIPAPTVTPKVGYEFEKWDKDLKVNLPANSKTYVINAKYTKLKDLYTGDQAKPEGYKTVTFVSDANGSLSGTLVYYVNPEEEVDFTSIVGQSITKTANTGYTADGGTWTSDNSKKLKDTFTNDTIFTYTFNKIGDIIKVDTGTVKPEGYATLTFKADANGKLEGNVDEIKYYVNPKANVKIVDSVTGAKQIAVPKTIASANYDFGVWIPSIDYDNFISGDLNYTATFTTSKVTLTYNKGIGEGTEPEPVIVPYNTNIRFATPVGLSRTNYTFDGWLVDGKKYKVGEKFTLIKNTEAVAQWVKDPEVIKFNSEDPKARPDDSYVKVSFVSDDGLVLENLNSYYVKKNSGLYLSNDAIRAPKIKEKTGYKSLGWDHTLREEIKGDDIVIKASSEPLEPVIPAIDGSGNTLTKPEGYKTVKFVAGAKGELLENNKKIEEKTYYVNPNTNIRLTPPNTRGELGYTFASWDKDATIPRVYVDEETTIKASFNEMDAVLKKEKPGYVKVTFEISGNGGKIAKDETTVYYVDPSREVTIDPPQTKAEVGYEFNKWNPDTTAKNKYTSETNVVGTFKEIDPIIPSTDINGKPNAKPEGYVTVTFDKGEHGSMTGQKLYYVNPKAGKKLSDITKPEIKAHIGYKFDKWDTLDNTEIKDTLFVIAEYTKLDDVIEDKAPRPEGYEQYISVKFSTEKNGTIDGTKKTKDLLVNPNKAVVLENQAPEVSPNTGYAFAGWDTSIHKAIQYKTGDIIKAIYNKEENVSTKSKPGYVRVEFKAGTNGSLSEPTEYWVKPGVTVTVPAPKVKPNTGYKFDEWDKNRCVHLEAGAKTYTITAIYKTIDDIVPGDLDQPARYNKVIFKTDGNGRLSGTRIFYVNPEKELDLNAKANALIKLPKVGYTNDGANWEPTIEANKKYTDEKTTYTLKFTELKDVEKEYHPGYVKVEFVAGDNGFIKGGNKTYYVNPNKNVQIGSKEIPIPETGENDNFKFDKWVPSFEEGDVINSDRKYVAQFKASLVTLTYNLNGATSGKTPSDVVMPYGTVINMASNEGITKDYHTFTGWKIGDKIYRPGEEYTLTGDVTAYANWQEDANIIPYDPNNPITRPDGFARVSFVADEGISLSGVKYYYVRKGVLITLGNDSIVKPSRKAALGYELDGWDKEDSIRINSDMVVTAKAKKLDDVIDSDERSKPEGYVEVKFEHESNGRILNGNKTYYVNPSKYVTITPPTTVANRGYVFGAWSQDATVPTVYKTDTTITAKFNKLSTVIPKTKNDESEKPTGYVSVTFEINGVGGKISDGETITYFVNPDSSVFINPPKTSAETGYEFDTWDQDTTTAKKKYKVNTTVKGSFKQKEAIIPSTDASGNTNAKPEGYVELKFLKGESGELKGQRLYYVNPNANQKVGDLAPTIEPDIGFDTDDIKWEVLGASAPLGNYKDEEINKDLTLQARYKKLNDVMDKNNLPGGKAPKGYIKVSFSTETNGKIKGTDKTEKVVYVNPNKAVALAGQAPEVSPNTGYDFAGWDTQITKNIQYKAGDVIKALFNETKDISETPIKGYVEVKLDGGAKGTLKGTTTYYVNPNKVVTIPAPTVNTETGYKQKTGRDAWDSALTQKFTKNKTITALYDKLDNIIPEDQEKPDGYIEVKFAAKYGTLSGTKTYYVNPNETVDLTDIANGLTKEPNVGYKAEGFWRDSLRGQFGSEKTFTFEFTPEVNVIKVADGVKQPKGYVKVTFIPTDKATDTKNTAFYVNPNYYAAFTDFKDFKDPEGREIIDSDKNKTTYTFDKWTVTKGVVATWKKVSEINYKFTQDTDITATYTKYVEPSNLPRAKKGVVTTIGVMPKPEDLIANKYTDDVDKKIKLQDGLSFSYEVEPKVNEAGTTIAKVKVTYPSGKTKVVSVGVKVVGDVEKQIGPDKPLVPEDYVKVVFDPTESATDETKAKQVFWVKKDKEVKITGITAPVGKDKNIGGVIKPNAFRKWQLIEGTSVKEYNEKTEITDTFTKDETTITALYEVIENVKPQAKDGQVLAKGSKPIPEDFIDNLYDYRDPNNKDNLPNGTQFAFVSGLDTSTAGKNKTVKIKVTYPNGEVKEVPVSYDVSGDVVEQTNPSIIPVVPPSFVKVTVDTTDKATADTKFTKTFWVDPSKVVTIPVDVPNGAVVTDSNGNPIKDASGKEVNWKFKGWKSEEESPRTWGGKIIARFTYERNITAQYESIVPEPSVEAKLVETYVGKVPDEYDYKDAISMMLNKTGLSFDKNVLSIQIIEKPVVSEAGMSQARIKINFNNGTSKEVTVPVKVHELLYPADTNGRKTAEIPEDYVKVTVDPTLLNEEPQIQIYYVNPYVDVVIPLPIIRPINDAKFINWIIDEDPNEPYNGETRIFKQDTRITAQYDKVVPPAVNIVPEVDQITVNQGDYINANTYIDHIKGLPNGVSIEFVRVISEPDTSRAGDTVAFLEVLYSNGERGEIAVPVKVLPKHEPDPRPSEPQIIYRDRIVEKEKIVEKIVKIKDNERLKELRYMQGYNGKFRPYDGLRRCEAAQILANALKADGYAYDPFYPISYTDIGDTWYTEAVRIVSQAGVFQGYSDGTFKPEGKITRAEWVATLRRFQDLKKVSGNDMGLSMGHWATEEIEAAYQAGWLDVYTSGIAYFDANAPITRQEVAAVSNKAFDRVLDKAYLKRNVNNMIHYKDINPSMPLYEDILCASNTLLTDGRYYKANAIDMDALTFNIITDDLLIYQKKFQFFTER